MEDMDCVTKIMEIWMTLDESEGGKTRRYYMNSSVTKQTKNILTKITLYYISSIYIKLINK